MDLGSAGLVDSGPAGFGKAVAEAGERGLVVLGDAGGLAREQGGEEGLG